MENWTANWERQEQVGDALNEAANTSNTITENNKIDAPLIWHIKSDAPLTELLLYYWCEKNTKARTGNLISRLQNVSIHNNVLSHESNVHVQEAK